MGVVAFVLVTGCSGGETAVAPTDAPTASTPSTPSTASAESRATKDDAVDAKPVERIVGRDCSRSVCDEMRGRNASLCAECHSLAMGSSDIMGTYSACTSVCAEPSCTDDDRRLCPSETATEASAPPPPTEHDLSLACNAAAVSTFLCGAELDCDGVVRDMRPDAASYYWCLDRVIGCEAMAGCALPASSFGDELCDALTARCPSSTCTAGTRASVNQFAGGLRDEVLARGRACLTRETCDGVEGCLSVWP